MCQKPGRPAPCLQGAWGADAWHRPGRWWGNRSLDCVWIGCLMLQSSTNGTAGGSQLQGWKCHLGHNLCGRSQKGGGLGGGEVQGEGVVGAPLNPEVTVRCLVGHLLLHSGLKLFEECDPIRSLLGTKQGLLRIK